MLQHISWRYTITCNKVTKLGDVIALLGQAYYKKAYLWCVYR